MFGGVICAIDRSSEAARVAAAAYDVAAQLGLRLLVADIGASERTATRRGRATGALERSEAFLEGLAEAAGLQGAELRVVTADRSGSARPLDAFLELVAREDAELLVVGRGGNTWQELVTRAERPVLVVPPWQDPEADARP
jgi:nucleotide-binding universal stress UspA family protein